MSKQIQHQMSKSERGKQVLVNIGQSYHNITSRMTIWGAGYKVRSITPLDPKTAVKEGAELVGETFVFTVSIGWLLYEYNNSATKSREADEAKRAAATAEREALRTQLHAIDVRLEALETALEKSSGVKYQAPPEKKHVVIAAPLVTTEDENVPGDATTPERRAIPQQQQQQQQPISQSLSSSSSSSSPNNDNRNSNNNHPTVWWRWVWPF